MLGTMVEAHVIRWFCATYSFDTSGFAQGLHRMSCAAMRCAGCNLCGTMAATPDANGRFTNDVTIKRFDIVAFRRAVAEVKLLLKDLIGDHAGQKGRVCASDIGGPLGLPLDHAMQVLAQGLCCDAELAVYLRVRILWADHIPFKNQLSRAPPQAYEEVFTARLERVWETGSEPK